MQRLTQSKKLAPCRFVFVLLLCLLRTTSALAPRPRRAPAPSRLSTDARRDATPESSSRRNLLALLFPVGVGLGSQAPLLGLIANPPDARRDTAPESSSRRNVLAAIAFPVAVGLGSQAPLLGLIANPPDAAARDEMLSSWCAADYCTLLGGGAGYGGASAFPGNYVEPDEEPK